MFLPITGLALSSIIGYVHKNEFKESKTENILIMLTILVMNLLMQYQMGREFVFVIVIMSLMLINDQEHKLRERLFFYVGVSLILCIYLFKNMYIRILLLLIILGTIIALEILNKGKNKKGLESFLKGLLMLTILLNWVENGKNIRTRYIKLWNTFNKSVVKT